MRPRFMLLAQLWIRVPHRIQKNKHDANVVFVGDGKKFVHALQETGRVLLPQQVVQEHTHRVHAQTLSPTKFAIDGCQVEGIGLPHFEFIDGRTGNEVASHQPWLLRVPFVGTLGWPRLVGRSKKRGQDDRKPKNRQNHGRLISHESSPLMNLSPKTRLSPKGYHDRVPTSFYLNGRAQVSCRASFVTEAGGKLKVKASGWLSTLCVRGTTRFFSANVL